MNLHSRMRFGSSHFALSIQDALLGCSNSNKGYLPMQPLDGFFDLSDGLMGLTLLRHHLCCHHYEKEETGYAG
jgi:hypothetical protein